MVDYNIINLHKQEITYLLYKELSKQNILFFYPEYSNLRLVEKFSVTIYDSEPYINGTEISEAIILLETFTELWMLILIKKFFIPNRDIDKLFALLDIISQCKEIKLVRIFELMLILFSRLTTDELSEMDIMVFNEHYKHIFIKNRKALMSLLDNDIIYEQSFNNKVLYTNNSLLNNTILNSSSDIKSHQHQLYKYEYTSGVKVELSSTKKPRSKVIKFSLDNKENISQLENINLSTKCFETYSQSSTIVTITAPLLQEHVLLIDKNVFNHGLFCIIKCLSNKAKEKAGNDNAIIPLKNHFNSKDKIQARQDMEEIRLLYQNIAYIPHNMKEAFLNFSL